jgi:transcriptional regulator with AAA-type ATPase domain
MKLTAEEREFFRLLTAAVFTNPFSRERKELDRRISGVADPHLKKEEHNRIVDLKIVERVKRLEQGGKANIRFYEGEEKRMVGIALLIALWNRFGSKLDSFILEQIAAGDKPIRVPFAGEVLGALTDYGFAPEEARKYFSAFYQLRRASYFIESAIIGVSPSMYTLRLQLWNCVFSFNLDFYDTHLWNRMEDFSTLLLGETGTGKGAAAAAIGRSCFIPFDIGKGCFVETFTRSFMAVNLSQYPESLIESELFGHRKGAFTGAVEHHEGVFSHCSPHGSIFLDEIGDLTVSVQTKLLKVLQERTFLPVGSYETRRFHGRVIAATNRPLDELRRSGQFRDDFYYRLCSDIINLPTLRQRLLEEPRELEVLVIHILSRVAGEARQDLVDGVLNALRRDLPPNYPWPGNVRELEQAVRRVLLTGSYQGDVLAHENTKIRLEIEEGNVDAPTLLKTYCRLLYERFGTYEEVSRHTRLDRRTVKKYLQQD